MNGIDPWLWLVPVAGFTLLLVVWRFASLGHFVVAERARESFRLQHERLQSLFLEQAQKNGTPRGLRWAGCTLEWTAAFARERKTRRVVVLVPATVQFEAVEGGEMEGLPAVPLPRHGTAVFHFHRGEWSTGGRVLFNLSPDQVLDQFAAEYEKLPAASGSPKVEQ